MEGSESVSVMLIFPGHPLVNEESLERVTKNSTSKK